METNLIGGVLIYLFELEAVVGVLLLAIVIGVLVRGLFDEHRRDGARSHREIPR